MASIIDNIKIVRTISMFHKVRNMSVKTVLRCAATLLLFTTTLPGEIDDLGVVAKGIFEDSLKLPYLRNTK
jgi:hypothetical protein